MTADERPVRAKVIRAEQALLKLDFSEEIERHKLAAQQQTYPSCVPPQWCRRLVKKERMRVWIHERALSRDRDDRHGWIVALELPIDPKTYGEGPFREFVEVKRNKKRGG